ncbi:MULTISPECIES: DMT family transporter [Clostridium]|uniref:EamA family transporter n=1 Tax=Clostridium sporogenes TaxID=1509 RepID=A0A7U5HZ95_CLOSG|nr:DMT family transporter [Clostridium sporogenes]AVP61365.1 EamA family transporter [Clostridium botulinum]AKC61471.1 putative membrane protein [Clostridium sporogenes]AKJ88798.1 transporter [Clostridium sporogenes]KCZ68776.1 putative membrane protein [Clostridium sporogenes]KRU41637.1 EamA-like transporter [Clostridium sporogenes]
MKIARIEFLLSMLIVGSIGLFVRSIPFSSAQIALVRGILGCAFVFVFSLMSGHKISGKNIKANLWILIASGIALSVNWILLFQAYKYTTISNATICYYFAPVLVMILSPLILKEPLSVLKVLCIVAALVGLACITGVSQKAGANDFVGILYGLGSAVLYATVIFLNKCLKDIKGIESSIVQLGVSAISLLAYVLMSEGFKLDEITVTPIVLLFIVGVIHTGVVYLLYFSSMRELSAQSVAALSYIDPVVAILLASIFLHEKMTIVQIIGGILILGTTFFNEIYAQKKKTSNIL